MRNYPILSCIVISISLFMAGCGQCGPIAWQHGGGNEKINQLLSGEYKKIGLETKVESSSYGEGTSCGGYIVKSYSFWITIYNPKESTQIYFEKTAKQVVDILFSNIRVSIEAFRIVYILRDNEISCSWAENLGYPEKTDKTHTCVFRK